MTPGDPGCHCCINNVFHSIDLSSRNTPQVRKNPSGSPCPPRDTSHCTHFASLKCNLGREAKAPSLAPEGAGQAAKLCPPKMPLLSTGGRKLKNFPFPRNGIILLQRSKPPAAPMPNPWSCFSPSKLSDRVLDPSSTFPAAQGFSLSVPDDSPPFPTIEDS